MRYATRMSEKRYVAHVGEKAPMVLMIGRQRLYCSVECANAAGFPLTRFLEAPPDDDSILPSDTCSKCGADLWREPAAT
jgi:hypothetical protein